jgi:hypothetical protein
MNEKSKSQSLPTKVKTAILLFSAAALIVVTLSVIFQQEWSIGRLALFMAVAVATARKKVQLSGTSTVSLLTSVVLLAIMLDGPGAAALVAICGVIVQTLQPNRKVVLHQAAFNVSMITLTVAATTVVYHFIARGQGFSADLLAMIAASMTYFFSNSVFVAIIVGLSKNTSVVRIWRESFAKTAPSFLIAGMLSLATVQLLANPTALFLLVPMMFPIYNSSIRLASRRLA